MVTSKMWKNVYIQKENQKRVIEDEKELKKKIRIENKIKKNSCIPTKNVNYTRSKKNIVKNVFALLCLQKKKKPSETITSDTPKSPIFIENQIDEDTIMISQEEGSPKMYTGLCLTCNQNLDGAHFGYECNFCSDQYHYNCLKKNNYCDIGLTNAILFICDKCEKNMLT